MTIGIFPSLKEQGKEANKKADNKAAHARLSWTAYYNNNCSIHIFNK